MSKKNSNGSGQPVADGPQPTPAMEWRKLVEADRRGHVVTLTSGISLRLRPVSMEKMLRGGKIPDELSPIAGKSIWTDIDESDIGESKELVAGMFDLVDLIVTASVTEPRIVENPTADDEISLDWLETEDKYEIYQLVTQPGWVLRKFCEQQNADVDAVSDSQDVQPTAVETVTG